ncbi:MAG: 5-methylcytosine-specific restriction enzyme subunit McrC [Oleiphilaceae bacterium]
MKGDDQKELMLIYPKTDKFKEPLPSFQHESDFTLTVVPFDLEKGELVGD